MSRPNLSQLLLSPTRHGAIPDAYRQKEPYDQLLAALCAVDLLEADEIIVKPFEVGKLAELIQKKMLTRKPVVRAEKQRVAAILDRCITSVVADWLARAKTSSELNHLSLSDDERTGHLPKLVRDLVIRLSKPSATAKDSDAAFSEAAVAHGKLRYLQGYIRRCWCTNRASSK